MRFPQSRVQMLPAQKAVRRALCTPALAAGLHAVHPALVYPPHNRISGCAAMSSYKANTCDAAKRENKQQATVPRRAGTMSTFDLEQDLSSSMLQSWPRWRAVQHGQPTIHTRHSCLPAQLLLNVNKPDAALLHTRCYAPCQTSTRTSPSAGLVLWHPISELQPNP